MGKGRIPSLPTVIVCPPTLIAQWRSELNRWLAKTACHILEYRGNDVERKIFFEPGSPYDRAIQGKYAERTIILVEAPVSIVWREGASLLM
jgi:SNF2 family DNA or RNA helicase